jgi:hypothetical protein
MKNISHIYNLTSELIQALEVQRDYNNCEPPEPRFAVITGFKLISI